MDHEVDDTAIYMSSFNMFPNFRRPINNPDKRIQSIKFSPDSEQLVAASNQRTLELYSCNTGQQENTFRLYKHGVSVVDFIDANNKVLVGSIGAMKGDYGIRALDMTKNEFATNYTGHTKPSMSLAVDRGQRFFVSGSHDRTVQLFDLRTPHAESGRTNLSSAPLVALHPQTELLAVALDDSRIELHDLRCLSYGPFTTFRLNHDQIKWTSLKFSPNGNQLLVSSDSSKIRLLNSFTGIIQRVFGCK